MKARPLFIFGVSGATWRVVDPLLESGCLPALARLRECGAHGTLRSVRAKGDKHYRPQVAWATLATGCFPDRHGVTAFFHEAADLREPSIWERYDRIGLSVGVFGWPGTWPPPDVRGFVVPSHLARDSRTTPPDVSSIKELDRLQQDAEREGGLGRQAHSARIFGAIARRHRIPPAHLLRLIGLAVRAATADPERRRLLLRRAKLELTADVFVDLYSRFHPDLAAYVTFAADDAMHRYWRYREPMLFGEHRGAPDLMSAIDDCFRDVDRMLDRILRVLAPGTTIFVLSEHGMAPEVIPMEVGPWFYAIRGTALLELARLETQIAAHPVARWVAFRSKTSEELPPDLAERLGRVIVVETGKPLFAVYKHDAEEIVVKLSLSPDVPEYAAGELERLRVVWEGIEIPLGRILRRAAPRRSAMHDEEGVFIVTGPGIRPGSIADARLIDVVPTLFHAAGLSVPDVLAGSVLDIFR